MNIIIIVMACLVMADVTVNFNLSFHDHLNEHFMLFIL